MAKLLEGYAASGRNSSLGQEKRPTNIVCLGVITKEALSEEADINYSYLAGVERGERNPSIRHLIKIAESLDVSL